jgi:hypothetical protein
MLTAEERAESTRGRRTCQDESRVSIPSAHTDDKLTARAPTWSRSCAAFLLFTALVCACGGRAVARSKVASPIAATPAETIACERRSTLEVFEACRAAAADASAAGERHRAIESLRIADHIALDLYGSSSPAAADIYLRRATAHERLGELPEALAQYEHAVPGLRVAGASKPLGRTLVRICELALEIGDDGRALGSCGRALQTVVEQHGYESPVAVTLRKALARLVRSVQGRPYGAAAARSHPLLGRGDAERPGPVEIPGDEEGGR